METREIAECMANGGITHLDREEQAGEAPWSEHPKFKGVHLKHLVKGRDTDGKLSCHMVRIDPGDVLEEHVHDGQWELHEVIEGGGRFVLGDREIDYYPGRMSVIPQGVRHKVIAGGEGLVLLAKFFPALL